MVTGMSRMEHLVSRSSSNDVVAVQPPASCYDDREPVDPGTPTMMRVRIADAYRPPNKKPRRSSRPRRSPDETRKLVQELIDQGCLCATEIAQQIDITPSVAARYMNELGVVPAGRIGRRRGRPVAELTACADCIHSGVCRLKPDRVKLLARLASLAGSAPRGLTVGFNVACRHAVATNKNKDDEVA